MKSLGWWEVRTGDGSENGVDNVLLGTFYGHVDDIALRLAGRQCGWWCDGKLSVKRVSKPKPEKLSTIPYDAVNVDFDIDGSVVKKMMRGRPVTVERCGQYGAVTLRRKR